MSNVKTTVRDGWVELVLNRPEARNALSADLLGELQEALGSADADTTVHAVLISGSGQDFCAGYDLRAKGGKAYSDSNAEKTGYHADLLRVDHSGRSLRSILTIRKPIVAKIHGNCLAGGTDLAFACDMVLAADDAVIGFPPTRDLGTPLLPMWLYHVGPQWAKRLLLTGDRISGEDAAKIGLVLKALPRDDLDREVEGLMIRLSRIDYELLTVEKQIVDAGLRLMGQAQLMDMMPEIDVRAHLAPTPLKLKASRPENVIEVLKARRNDLYGTGLARVTGPDPYDDQGRIQ